MNPQQILEELKRLQTRIFQLNELLIELKIKEHLLKYDREYREIALQMIKDECKKLKG